MGRLVRRQRLMLLLFLTFLTLIIALRFRQRIDWYSDAPIRVLLLELTLPGTETTNRLMAFNGTPVREPAEVTVKCVEEFFPREFERYNEGQSARVELHVSGPYQVEVDPPDVYDPDASAVTLMWRSLRYHRYFQGLAEGLGVDFDDYDARMVAVFVPGDESEQIEAGSMASRGRRFGVVYLNLAHMDYTYSALTLVHEIGHTFGATDKYDYDSFLAVWPAGFADPTRSPAFPQEHAELMAGDIPITEQNELEIDSMDQVRIGVKSAEEMGWLTALDSWKYYRSLPDAPPPPPQEQRAPEE